MKSFMDNTPILMPTMECPTVDLRFDRQVVVEGLATVRQDEAWSLLKFACAMKGLIVNPRPLEYVRIEGNEVRSRDISIRYNKCHIFPDQKIKTDLKVKTTEGENNYKIIDFMRLKFCDASNLGSLFTKSNFISTVESIGKKELFAVSTLTQKQLMDFDYSDTMVKFNVQKLIENEEGLHRPLVNKDRATRRKPQLEVVRRLVLPMEEVVYESSKKVKYYDAKKRSNVIKAYSGYSSSI